MEDKKNSIFSNKFLTITFIITFIDKMIKLKGM